MTWLTLYTNSTSGPTPHCNLSSWVESIKYSFRTGRPRPRLIFLAKYSLLLFMSWALTKCLLIFHNINVCTVQITGGTWFCIQHLSSALCATWSSHTQPCTVVIYILCTAFSSGLCYLKNTKCPFVLSGFQNKRGFHMMNLGSHALIVLRRVSINDHNEKMDESKMSTISWMART